MLIFSPAVFLISLAVAFSFGLSFLLITTFSSVFQDQYGFSLGISGLSYLGMGSGMLVAVTLFSFTSDKVLRWHVAKGFVEPENRLAMMAAFTPVMPIGFFWYGWAADAKTHWIVPIIGAAFIGFSSLFIMVSMYLWAQKNVSDHRAVDDGADLSRRRLRPRTSRLCTCSVNDVAFSICCLSSDGRASSI